MVEMVMFNIQRGITQKVGKPELRFIRSAHCLMVLYIGGKFSENSSSRIKLWCRHETMKH